MGIVNDNSCFWINDLQPRFIKEQTNINETCDWLIVGSGITGLSAARKLGEIHPNQKSQSYYDRL